MFPFSTVVECPQNEMLAKIGPTLGLFGDHAGPGFRQATERCNPHRPDERRTDPDDQVELAATA